MKETLDRIEKKLDEHTNSLADIKADLKYHIRRTDIAEERLDRHDEELKPVKTTIAAARAVLWLGAACGAIAGILKLLGI